MAEAGDAGMTLAVGLTVVFSMKVRFRAAWAPQFSRKSAYLRPLALRLALSKSFVMIAVSVRCSSHLTLRTISRIIRASCSESVSGQSRILGT